MTIPVKSNPRPVGDSTQIHASKPSFKDKLNIKVKSVAQKIFKLLAFCFKAAVAITASVIVITAVVTISPLIAGAVFFHRRSKKLDPNYDDTPKESFFKTAAKCFTYFRGIFNGFGSRSDDSTKKESFDTTSESKHFFSPVNDSNNSKVPTELVNELD